MRFIKRYAHLQDFTLNYDLTGYESLILLCTKTGLYNERKKI